MPISLDQVGLNSQEIHLAGSSGMVLLSPVVGHHLYEVGEVLVNLNNLG